MQLENVCNASNFSVIRYSVSVPYSFELMYLKDLIILIYMFIIGKFYYCVE